MDRADSFRDCRPDLRHAVAIAAYGTDGRAPHAGARSPAVRTGTGLAGVRSELRARRFRSRRAGRVERGGQARRGAGIRGRTISTLTPLTTQVRSAKTPRFTRISS